METGRLIPLELNQGKFAELAGKGVCHPAPAVFTENQSLLTSDFAENIRLDFGPTLGSEPGREDHPQGAVRCGHQLDRSEQPDQLGKRGE